MCPFLQMEKDGSLYPDRRRPLRTEQEVLLSHYIPVYVMLPVSQTVPSEQDVSSSFGLFLLDFALFLCLQVSQSICSIFSCTKSNALEPNPSSKPVRS